MKRIVLLIIGLVTSAQVNSQALTDGLVFLYNFVGNAADSSGNQIDGIVNGATLTEDRFGNPNSAYYFDGVDDNIELPYSTLMRIDPPVTFSFFAKLESTGQPDMKFFKTDYNDFDYNGYWMDGSGSGSGQIQLHWGGGLGTTGPENRRSKFSDSRVTTGVWHHIAGVIRDFDDMDIYIDCHDAAGFYSGSGPLTISHTTSGGKIGEAPVSSIQSTNYYHGSLDQLAMWNRALTFGDITKICDGQLEPVIASLRPVREPDFSFNHNPFLKQVKVACKDWSNSNTILRIRSVDGRVCFSENLNGRNSVLISTHGLAQGIYVLTISDNENRSSVKLAIQIDETASMLALEQQQIVWFDQFLGG